MQKLPSSIKWLLEKRGRIDGSIQKIEEYLDHHKSKFEKYQQLTAELLLLKEALSAVDQTLKLHKLQIDPLNIPVIKGRNPITDMKRGELTKLIYARIKKGNGEPVASNVIVESILEKRQTAGAPLPIKVFLGKQVGKRLKSLCQQGLVIRHHLPSTKSYGFWTLSEKITQDIQMGGDGLGNIP